MASMSTSASGDTDAQDASAALTTTTCEWEKFIDEGSQTPYYYNARTGESSWSEPEGYVDRQTAAPALPPQWRKYEDDSTGATYYYDEANDVTQWDEPMGFVDDASDVDDGEGSGEGEASGEGDDNEDSREGSGEDESDAIPGTSAARIADSDAVPAGGERATASLQGDVKQHVASSSDVSPPQDAAVAPAAAAAGTTDSDAAPQPPQQQQHQTHWVKHVDAASGRAYYHDTASGQTQWDAPIDFVETTAATAPPMPIAAAAAEYQAHLGRVRAEQMARVTRQVLDPTGSLARLNAVLSSVNAANSSSSSSRSHSATAANVTADPDNVSASDGSASARARKAEWQQHVDPHTQRFYYHNVVTGATQWHAPDARVASGLADWLPPTDTTTAEHKPTVSGVAYAATATFNRASGKFAHDAIASASAMQADRATRHMSHFFDLSALEQNRADAKVLQQKLKRERIDWKKVAAEKKAKKRKQQNEWLYHE